MATQFHPAILQTFIGIVSGSTPSRYRLAFLTAALLLSLAQSALSSVLAGPIRNPSNGHDYYLLSSKTWTGSEAEAVAMGGHLTTINDASENQWVYDRFSNYNGSPKGLWIGLTDKDKEGIFKWISGQQPSYTNWSPESPNNTYYDLSPENYVMIWYQNADSRRPAKSWEDLPDIASIDGTPIHGVVEIESPSISTNPQSKTVDSGQSVTFQVSANGSGTLAYQWKKDGVPLPGATSPVYTIPSVQPWHIGDYTVVITGSGGSLTSNAALLSINNVPTGIWKGIVAVYPLDGNANDLTSFGSHGTATGTTSGANRLGIAGRALSFDGIDDVIRASNVPLPLAGQARTLSLWAKATPVPGSVATLVQWGFPNNGQAFGIIENASPYTWWAASWGGGNDANSGVAVDSQWHHVVATYDGTLRIYIDGVLKGSNSVPINTGSSSLHIGASVGNYTEGNPMGAYGGLIDDLRIYNRALSSTEVQQLYAAQDVTLPSNVSPVATNDTIHAVSPQQNGTISLEVTANDSDADGDALSIAGVSQAAKGSVTVGSTGKVEYTPGPNYDGNDSFTYSITDGNGGFATATVTLVNAKPAAANDQLHAPATLASFQIDVLSNDTDPDTGDPLSISEVTQGSKGTVTTNGVSITYAPGAGYSGNDVFTYKVRDGHGGSALATVTLLNEAPAANGEMAQAGRTPVEIQVLGNDSDSDGDTLNILGVTQGAKGTVTVNGTSLIYSPGPAFKDHDAFTYTIDDGRGGQAAANVTVILSEISTDYAASKGDAVPGESQGAVFSTYGPPSINSAGEIAFLAKFKTAAGKWHSGIFAGLPLTKVAQTTDSAPGIPGMVFQTFKDPVLNKDGKVAFCATVAGVPRNTDSGIWTNARSSSALELIAREGTEAPGVPGGMFSTFHSIALTDTGRLVFVATLTKGVGGVNGTNGLGVWASDPSGVLRLVLREGDVLTIGGKEVTVRNIGLFQALAGSPGQRRGFNSRGDVLLRLAFTNKSSALVRVSAQYEFEDVAASGAVESGINGHSFENFGIGELSDTGAVSFRATLKRETATGATAANRSVIVARDAEASTLRLVARAGNTVPESAGAVFENLGEPVASPAGDVAFVGKLRRGFGGVTQANDTAIWLSRSSEPASIFLREGDAAPGLNGGKFASFESLAFTGNRIAFVGTLAAKAGGVTRGNDVGLWAQDRTGALNLLLREGQTFEVNGTQKQLKSFTVLSAVPTSPSQGHSYSDNGGYAYRATFTDGTQGIFSVWVP